MTFKSTRLNLEHLNYFATVTRLDFHMSEELEIVCMMIYFETHGCWITICSQGNNFFRYIVKGNCGTMIFQAEVRHIRIRVP